MNRGRFLSLFTIVVGAALPLSAGAQVVFSDDFNVDSSASWNVNSSNGDTSATFAFDYSTIGVPPSPNGGGSTLGLRLASNLTLGAVSAVTVSPMGQSFSGYYQLRFDAWLNANGPFPGGGAGSTEFITAGIGYDDVTPNRGGATGSGGWFAVDGEGGSSRDYRAYKTAGEQFAESGQFFAGLSSAGGGAHNNSDPYYMSFGNIDVALAVPNQTASHPQQTGTTAVGAMGFAWHEMVITVSGTTALWEIDGLPIAELDASIGSSFNLDGNISLGTMDIFSSLSSDADVSFVLFDNVQVIIPAPGALAVLGLGGLVAVRRRR